MMLAREADLYPDNLLERSEVGLEPERRWWAIYTLSRREKDLMRRLAALNVPFYGPVVENKVRSPQGRVRTSHLPLFSNYVFVYGDVEQRYLAQTTGCVSRYVPVPDSAQLTRDLRTLRDLIRTGAPVTLEERLEPGTAVRVKSGPFAGHTGVIVERREGRRLIVAVNFLQQGASVKLDDFSVEKL